MTKSRGIHDMHGCRNTRAYAIWSGMRSRCNNPNSPAYSNYGARGISVAPEWERFSTFIADMGHPADGMTLERVDNDKGYSKLNCVWATRTEQGRNKRNNVLITIGRETLPLSVWAERYGIAYKTAHMRLRKGWSPEDAVKTPLITQRAGIKRNVPLHKASAEMVSVSGELMTLKSASEKAGLAYDTVCQRIKKGWAISDALSAPPHRGKRDKGTERGVKFREFAGEMA
jgi:hypothetical protein